ncbi:HYC_CC_PP family protein [Flavisolibacter nicotianae]|uniref:HYC_CC_PP family protein n=1 Tax=Flavisolibacter nicotianae TaxID=2364882 RepID=UPI0013C4EBA9|nr:hypothetical protein [Flavisolibacter nicotianae]
MKKLFASILLPIYFVVSTGFVISFHYCMDELKSFQLGDVSRHRCSECGMPIKDSKGCCKDEVKVVKMHVDQVLAKLAGVDFSLPHLPVTTSIFLLIPPVGEPLNAEPVAHGPPLSEQDTYLQNRVFRI